MTAPYVNWSADDVALVPVELVTVTSTVPEPAGAFTRISVSERMNRLVAVALPNLTDLVPPRPVPVIHTGVSATPWLGPRALIVGCAWAVKVYRSAAPGALVPPVVVTVTSTGTALASAGGLFALITPGLSGMKNGLWPAVPNVTLSAGR